MKNSKVAGLLLLTVLFNGYAFAEEPTASALKHQSADANKDGNLSYDEYRAANEKKMEARFKRMDTNGDGTIDASEKQKIKDKMSAMRAKRKSEKQPVP